MGRLPYQVLVILYFREKGDVKYCVFERVSPRSQFQFIAGGGENSESPIEAARREVFEEAGLTNVTLTQLTSVCHIPTNIFSHAQRQAWGNDTFVIPEYAFCAEVTSQTIKLSDEHLSCQWVSYDQALALLQWDSNKTALYEVRCRMSAADK